MSDPRLSHGSSGRAVSLNALKAFESAARHLSFTAAADELSVTQAAVSHQVKALELRLGFRLFRRTPRGLVVTDEGLTILPTLSDTFDRLNAVMAQFEDGRRREVLTVSVVGSFALGWLMPRLKAFEERCPFVDLRLMTNNNRVDVAGESLDYAIRFGDGAWQGLDAVPLLDAPLSPLCAPHLAERLREPGDLKTTVLLRSYRAEDWPAWLSAAGVEGHPVRGPIFDSSVLMAQAAMLGHGVALVPPSMFEQPLAEGRLAQPFPIAVNGGRYWLVRLRTRPVSPAMRAFQDWLSDACRETPPR